MRRSLVFVLALVVLGMASVAVAGDLFTLCGKVVTADPGVYPYAVQFDVHKGKEPTDLRGSATAMFDGVAEYDVSCDPVSCITGIALVDGMLEISFCAEGYKDGKFEADSFFDVFVDGFEFGVNQHTSCSKPIWVDTPYAMVPAGSGVIIYSDGTGNDCSFYTAGECPPNPEKLIWFSGKFEVDCDAPADVTFNVYKDAADLKGTATAHFDGVGLSGVMNSFSARLKSAVMVGDTMRIVFDAYGTKDFEKFDKNTRFELVVENCGAFYIDMHTSCSQEIIVGTPGYDLMPDGYFEIMNCCGECCGFVPVEDKTWGSIKSLYK